MKGLFAINCRTLFSTFIAIISIVATIALMPGQVSAQMTIATDTAVTNQVIAIDQLKIGAITVTGNRQFSSEAILSLLPALKSGAVLNVQSISAEVVSANSNPALKVAVDIQPMGDSIANIIVRVVEQKAFRSMIYYDNTGDDQTGKNRMGFLFIDYNWLGKAETAVLSYTKAPNNNMVNQFGFLNSIPLPKTGDKLTISGSYSNVNSGTVADYFNISGKGKSLGANYNHKLKSSSDVQRSIDFGIDYKEYDNVIDFSGTNLATDIKTLPVSVAYQYSITGAGSHFNANIGFTRNIGSASSSQSIFDATRTGAVANYTVWRQSAAYQKQLPKGWLFNAQLESQYANTPLISGEEFGLGGSHSVRGFNERNIAGDKGVRLTTEIYTPEISKGQRFLTFIDQGKFWLNNPTVFDRPSGSIASYGVGWRLDTPGGASIAVDWAKVLRGTDTNPEGSTKVHVFVAQSL